MPLGVQKVFKRTSEDFFQVLLFYLILFFCFENYHGVPPSLQKGWAGVMAMPRPRTIFTPRRLIDVDAFPFPLGKRDDIVPGFFQFVAFVGVLYLMGEIGDALRQTVAVHVAVHVGDNLFGVFLGDVCVPLGDVLDYGHGFGDFVLQAFTHFLDALLKERL